MVFRLFRFRKQASSGNNLDQQLQNPEFLSRPFSRFAVLLLKFICLYALKGDKEALRKMPLDLMITSCCPK